MNIPYEVCASADLIRLPDSAPSGAARGNTAWSEGRPEEIAAVELFLAVEKTGLVAGINLPVDGAEYDFIIGPDRLFATR